MGCSRKEHAISEIVGTMLILGISIALFSIVYISLLTTTSTPLSPSVDIIGTIEGNTIIIEHRGGKSVDINANLIIEIAGIRQPTQSINEFMSVQAQNNEKWNVGETIRYPAQNLSDRRVDLGIGDVSSNSLVLYSNIQEGYSVPSFGRGGIWHFDESSGSTAYDSSGNNNHGTIYEAERVAGVNSTPGLFFNGLNSFVYVPDSPGLDIQGNISIEAWVHAKTIKTPINQTEFDVKTGYYPNITQVNDDIFAVTYRLGANKNKPLTLKTVEIASDGSIENSSIDNITVDTGGYEPIIIRLNETRIAIIYADASGTGIIKTYGISSDGEISSTLHSQAFAVDCEVASYCRVDEHIYAIAYGSDNENPMNDGSIVTVEIMPDGTIQLIDTLLPFSNECGDPDIIKLVDNSYIVAYIEGSTDDALMFKTFTINDSYQISETPYELSNGDDCEDPAIIGITENIVAVAFTDGSDYGALRTYSIDGDGQISDTGNHLIFDDFRCYDADIMELFPQVYAIGYESGPSHRGRVVKVNILPNGTIDHIISTTDYDPNNGYEPDLFKISRHIFGIVYREDTNPHPGGLATFSFFNDIGYEQQNAGIYKQDTFSLFANQTTVKAGINDQSIECSLDPGWNHIVLTYNQSEIALYVNATLEATVAYSDPLIVTNHPLYIGDYFYGTMDEVAIFDYELTMEEITHHYTYPGSLMS